MSELFILIFVLYILYLAMKKPKITTEKPTPKAKTEQPVAAVATETKAKKPNPTQKTPNKSQAVAPKPVPKVNTEQPVATVVTEAKPKKLSPDRKTTKKAKTVTPKPVTTTSDMPMPERVGLTAGSIWHYLSENGTTPVAKVVRELPEEEKIIQRSIGWLAQEGKITLDTSDRVETISLTG